jgi:hypothetical protein
LIHDNDNEIHINIVPTVFVVSAGPFLGAGH